MGSQAINGPLTLPNADFEEVWFEGNGSTSQSVLEGQGVCYNWDYGTAATAEAQRMNRVELPTILNAPWFAGVLDQNYTVPATGTFVRIYKPGSTCNVLSRVANVVGVGRTTCIAGGTYAGYFDKAGFAGQGSGRSLQTIDRSATAGLCLVKLESGEQSGLIEIVTPLAAGGATVFMVGGVSYVDTAVTLAADATFTLADGTIPGMRKAFCCRATMTTNNIVVTVTSGVQGVGNADPSAALATITVDADNMETVLEWGGVESTSGLWAVVHTVGSTLG